MKRKKHHNQVARIIRKEWKLSFAQSQAIARLLAKGDTYEALTKAGFEPFAEWKVKCGRGCCRGPTGRTGWDKSDVKEAVFSENLAIYRYKPVNDFHIYGNRFALRSEQAVAMGNIISNKKTMRRSEWNASRLYEISISHS